MVGMDSEKLDDMEQLFLNMHNLINAFRPHQVRKTWQWQQSAKGCASEQWDGFLYFL